MSSSSTGFWWVRGVGKQTAFHCRPLSSVSPCSTNLRPSTPPPQLCETASSSSLSSSPPSSPLSTPRTSLYELEGYLDLVVLSYLIEIPHRKTPLDVTDTSTTCSHYCRCPATCAECSDLSRRNWGIREAALSRDSKQIRAAQVTSCRLASVCRRWYDYVNQASSHRSLWSRISFRTIAASNSMCTQLVSAIGINVQHVDMSNQKCITDVAIHAVLTQCQGLQSLSARRCQKIKGDCFAMEGIQAYARVKYLTLAGCDGLKDSSLQHIGKYFGDSLETLNVSGSKLLSGKQIGKLAKQLQKIISIDAGGTKITNSAVLHFLKKCNKTLRSLNVGGTNISEEWIADVMGRDYHDCLIYSRR